jgi:multicomponent Na+:H+ antiporter subunit A
MSWLHMIILFPFIFAMAVPLLYKKFAPSIHTGWFVLFVPLLVFSYLLTFITQISQGNTFSTSVSWLPAYGINFTTYVDGLSLVFGILISGIGALVILYSIFYMSKHREALHNFYVYLLLFMGAMLGLVFSDNIYVLYVFWEMTSVSSFLLIAYWYQREKSRYGAQKSMLITIFGGLAMLAGFIMLGIISETYSIREMIGNAEVFPSHPLFVPAMILLLIGAFTKSAQFPFSIWLPDAMEAPTPISAYLHSATMVKAGIYLVARFTPIFGGTSEWFWLVSGVGIITLFYGSINAVRQTDLKALLAYSTISQLGLIMSLLGLGSASLYDNIGDDSKVYALAVFAAIFHLVNHSTFKGCLFMVVGIIDHETGTRDIRRLGGLMSLMPISFTLAVIGGFAMAGLPPFNGFLSKEMFFTAVLNASQMEIFNVEFVGVIFPILAWTASVFTFIYSMIIIFKTFRGKNKPEKLGKQVHEAPIGLLIPPIVLASLVILLFFFPNVLSQYLLKPALNAVLPALAQKGELSFKISAWHGWNAELWMTIGVIGIGTILYIYLKKWYRIYLIYPESLTLNHFYDLGLEKMEDGSRQLTSRYMTGYIRDYLVYIFAFIIVFVGGSLWLLDGFFFNPSSDAAVNFFEVGLMISMVIAALTVLFSRNRITSIVAVGGLGFLVAFFFVLFRAPDLALTQLVVETVTTALFLLCFYHLPQLRKEITRIRFKAVNAAISIGIGAVVTIVALSANGNRLFASISSYYEKSYELAGAKNIVNAILVDFRGFDTMLEILVLCIAGLGVYTLIKLRTSGGDRNEGTE